MSSRGLNVPRRHQWFFETVCDSCSDDYLKCRRLLEVTCHSPKSAVVPISSREPLLNGRFDDASWSEGAISDPFVLNGIHSQRGAPQDETVFKVLRHEEHLYVSIRAEDLAGIGRIAGKRDVVFGPGDLKRLPYHSDYLSLIFDPHHRHDEYVEFFAAPSGARGSLSGRRTASLYPVHPLSTPVSKEENDAGFNARWELKVQCDKDKKGWTAMFKIPLSLVRARASGGQLAPVIGFNAHRFKHSSLPEQSLWSPIGWNGENVEVPLRLGDMYFDGPPVTLGPLWLGEWLHGENHMVVEARNHATRDLPVQWVVEVCFVENPGVCTSRHSTLLLPGQNIVSIPYHVHDVGRGSIRLRLFVHGSSLPIYDGAYWLDASLRLDDADPKKSLPKSAQPLLVESGAETTPPDASHNYNLEKMASIASRLPRMIRVNTADGAPSDFCLRSADGRLQFNLMEPGALKRIARMIESRFADPDERLAAASIFATQPDVLVYECIEAFSELANTPLSIMRFGSGICGAFATVIKGVVEELTPPHEGRYVAYKCGLRRTRVEAGQLAAPESHTLAVVFSPDGRKIILNNGALYYCANTGKLLTERQMEEWEQALPLMLRFEGSMIIDSGSAVWPAGAPPE